MKSKVLCSQSQCDHRAALAFQLVSDFPHTNDVLKPTKVSAMKMRGVCVCVIHMLSSAKPEKIKCRDIW